MGFNTPYARWEIELGRPFSAAGTITVGGVNISVGANFLGKLIGGNAAMFSISLIAGGGGVRFPLQIEGTPRYVDDAVRFPVYGGMPKTAASFRGVGSSVRVSTYGMTYWILGFDATLSPVSELANLSVAVADAIRGDLGALRRISPCFCIVKKPIGVEPAATYADGVWFVT